MILSAIIVKDALWGLRISDWLNYLKITKNVRQVVIIPINWFIDGIAPMMLTPFILYILSGVKQHKDEPNCTEISLALSFASFDLSIGSFPY